MADIVRNCLCGASYRGSSLPTRAAEHIGELFDQQHAGPGHVPATAHQAAKTRRRADDEEVRRER